jgi:hypothetical protein
MAGAGGSGLLAIATLLSGGGFLTAFLVYVLAGSVIVPLLAVAPLARASAAAAGRRFRERRTLRHPAGVEAASACVSRT